MHDRLIPPLVFPKLDRPGVSVVIPVYNKWTVTHACLAALLSAQNSTPYEVIVVDDASTDDTQRLPEQVQGITVVRSETNQGFVHSCNAGAECARGDYIAFLNNDTEPASRWLDEMILVFRNFPDVGLVGSKLLYPDGRLQDAGGIVWSNGDPWNYGRGQDPDRPEFTYTRQADYLSGASITVDRDTWQRVGGFSEEFAPAYFEDTDLAFKVRSIGKKTVFAPFSVVIHHEGISSGTDTRSGVKKYQEMNRPMFKAKWADVIAEQPTLGTDARLAAEHRAGHRRVLFVDREVPQPSSTDGGYQSIQEMRLLQSLGYKVTFIPERQVPRGPETECLQRMGIEVAYGPYVAGLGALLEQRGSEFDLVYVAQVDTAARVIGLVRRWAPGTKIMLKVGDPDSLGEKRSGRSGPAKAIVARVTRDREPPAVREAAVVLLLTGSGHPTSPNQRLSLGHVAVAPCVVDVVESVVPPAAREGIAFVGNYSLPNDRQAVEFLCRDVMPLVRERRPGTTLHVYGSGWRPDVTQRLTTADVAFEGPGADIADVYGNRRVTVQPVASGEGLQGRIADALAHGVPLVLSRMAQERTGLRDRLEVYVAATATEWADRIITLCDDDEVWQALSDASRRHAKETYSFERGRSLMRTALELAGEHVTPITEALVVRDARPDWTI